MAVDADTARQVESGASSGEDPEASAHTPGSETPQDRMDAVDLDGESTELEDDADHTRQRWPMRPALIVLLIVCATLTGLLAWFGWRDWQAQQLKARNNLYIEVGKQAALNLTSISYTEVDADVQRILASSTGGFHDDFQQRAQPFIDVVKQAQSKSEGTVTAAGLESVNGDQAQVLVAVSVKTTIANGPQQDPRGWRMRVEVIRDGENTAKVSNVEFVP